jgi:hypothetical protein
LDGLVAHCVAAASWVAVAAATVRRAALVAATANSVLVSAVARWLLVEFAKRVLSAPVVVVATVWLEGLVAMVGPVAHC